MFVEGRVTLLWFATSAKCALLPPRAYMSQPAQSERVVCICHRRYCKNTPTGATVKIQ